MSGGAYRRTRVGVVQEAHKKEPALPKRSWRIVIRNPRVKRREELAGAAPAR